MGLPYIKIQPEEALQILDNCIVSGYQAKDKITQEYYSDKQKAAENIARWQKIATDWANDTIQKLGEVFVSQKELYNFRDAEPPFGATSENVHYVGIVSRLKARVDKLNEYDSYIRNRFNVKVEVVGRDKIVQVGDGAKVEIKN